MTLVSSALAVHSLSLALLFTASPASSIRFMFEELTSPPLPPLPSSYFILQQLVDAGQTSSPSPQIREQNEMEQDEMEQDEMEQDEMEQDEMRQNEEDKDTDEDDDGVLFGSLDKARNVSIDLMKQLKEEFGTDVAKNLVIESAKAVGIALHGNRDTSITIDMRLGLGRICAHTLQHAHQLFIIKPLLSFKCDEAHIYGIYSHICCMH